MKEFHLPRTTNPLPPDEVQNERDKANLVEGKQDNANTSPFEGFSTPPDKATTDSVVKPVESSSAYPDNAATPPEGPSESDMGTDAIHVDSVPPPTDRTISMNEGELQTTKVTSLNPIVAVSSDLPSSVQTGPAAPSLFHSSTRHKRSGQRLCQ